MYHMMSSLFPFYIYKKRAYNFFSFYESMKMLCEMNCWRLSKEQIFILNTLKWVSLEF